MPKLSLLPPIQAFTEETKKFANYLATNFSRITELINNLRASLIYTHGGTLPTTLPFVGIAYAPTFGGEIMHVRANAKDVTVEIRVDVLLDGTSVFPTGTKPTVPVGAGVQIGVVRVPDERRFDPDSVFQVEQETGAGSDLVVQIDFKRSQ